MRGIEMPKDFDFEIPIDKPTITVDELIEILQNLGFKVEDYWKGNVDDRKVLLRWKRNMKSRFLSSKIR